MTGVQPIMPQTLRAEQLSGAQQARSPLAVSVEGGASDQGWALTGGPARGKQTCAAGPDPSPDPVPTSNPTSEPKFVDPIVTPAAAPVAPAPPAAAAPAANPNPDPNSLEALLAQRPAPAKPVAPSASTAEPAVAAPAKPVALETDAPPAAAGPAKQAAEPAALVGGGNGLSAGARTGASSSTGHHTPDQARRGYGRVQG